MKKAMSVMAFMRTGIIYFVLAVALEVLRRQLSVLVI